MSLRTYVSTVCRLAFILGLGMSSATAAAPSAADFQQSLVRQVDRENADRYAVIPLYPDDGSRQLAQAIIAELWKHQAYREDMQKWLDAHPAQTQEDLVSAWFRHYHGVLLPGFEFLDDEVLKVLYRLQGNKLIYALKRADCRTTTTAELGAAMQQAHTALIAEHKASLASSIAAAYLRELARLNAPKPGDRPVQQVIQAMTMKAFQEVKGSLPPADQPILDKAFSYQPNKKSRPLHEGCEEDWVAVHAIVDAATGSAPILRRSTTHAAYAAAFAEVDRPIGASRPTTGNFTPGKAFIYKPVLLARQNVVGTTTLVLHVDTAGKVEKVAIGSSTLAPASVTSADGRVFSSSELLLPVLETYYRAGSFAPHMKDGVATANVINIPIEWR